MTCVEKVTALVANSVMSGSRVGVVWMEVGGGIVRAKGIRGDHNVLILENNMGLEAGHEHGSAGRSLSVVDAYNPEAAKANYIDAVKALEDVDFPLVNLLKSKKDAGMYEVLDCFLLDGPAADLPEVVHLHPCLEQLMVPIYHTGDKTIVGETSLSFALMNVHTRAKGAKKHAAALRKLMIDIVSDPLSSQTWVGEASTSAAHLSVEDYQKEDTDEALGSVVAIPHTVAVCGLL
ncbi:hypothetical protein Tco_1455011 [Tanacetum coccineum]